MADHSKIEWTDATWNPITGCSVVSPGCTNCYAMKLAGGRLQAHPSRAGLTAPSRAGPVWTGEVRLNEEWLSQPLRWAKPRRIFVCAHGDLFHPGVPIEWIDRVVATMAVAHWHTFQVVTKRADLMQAYFNGLPARLDELIELEIDHPAGRRQLIDLVDFELFTGPLPNVWLGISAEDQIRLDERVVHLLDTPSAVRFVSAEPLLGPVDFKPREASDQCIRCGEGPDGRHAHPDCYRTRGLDWIIVGGESGPGARPMHPAWVERIRDDCAKAGVAFFFKQWGEWRALSDQSGGFWPADAGSCIRLNEDGSRSDDGLPLQRVGKAFAGRLLDGVEHDAMPVEVS